MEPQLFDICLISLMSLLTSMLLIRLREDESMIEVVLLIVCK